MRILRNILPLLVGALMFVILSSAPEAVYSFRGVLQEAAVTISLLVPTWEAVIVSLITGWAVWVLLGKWMSGTLLVETPEGSGSPHNAPQEPAEEQVLRDQSGRRPHEAVRHAIMEGRK